MFKWYAKAAECYVFLDDFSGMLMTEDEELEEEAADRAASRKAFEKCRWFTRGWTLQELLAPTAVLFFNSKRTIIGTRVELLDWISRASRIQPQYLTGEAMIAEASVAQRMSWASNRVTSRPEDIASGLLLAFGAATILRNKTCLRIALHRSGVQQMLLGRLVLPTSHRSNSRTEEYNSLSLSPWPAA
jgi:hypothetical protein